MKDVGDLFKNDKVSSDEELLEKDGSDSVHHKNIQSLAIEMLQKKTWPFSWICNWYFCTGNKEVEFREKLRLQDTFCKHSVSWFWKHLLLRSQKLGNCSGKNKWIHFSKQFQKKIRNWVLQNCPCKHRFQIRIVYKNKKPSPLMNYLLWITFSCYLFVHCSFVTFFLWLIYD